MHAAILYELEGDPDVDEIPSQLDGDLPAIDASRTEYLDGKTLHHGRAAARVTDDVTVPTVNSDGIGTETEEQQRRVMTDWYVDLEERWAGVDSADGEFFVKELILSIAGVLGQSREIALDEWGEAFLEKSNAHVWGLNYGQEDGDGNSVRAGSAFHTDVSLDDVQANLQDVSGIGFRYNWDGHHVHGSIFESGYVAVFKDWPPERFARWLADEVLPYMVVAAGATTQDTLDEEEDEDACDQCGSVPKKYDLREDAGDMVCIVCKDKREEEREETVKESAARADGGDHDGE